MANDAGWQRRSDNWVTMLEQSRLHKEKCRVAQEIMSANKPKEKTAFQLNKPGHDQAPEQKNYDQDRKSVDD